MAQDVLGLALAGLPAELASPAAVAAVAAVAAAAPPFNAVGLECRLAGDDWQLDFQLGTRRQECDSVVRFFDRHRDDLSPAWDRVSRFCREWTTPGTRLYTGAAELWCELDVAGDAGEPSLAELLPSVFVAFEPLAPGEWPATTETVIDTFVPEESAEDARQVLRRCVAACPSGARVSHLGVMLGRPIAGLRVHVIGLRPTHVEGFLADIDWPGDRSEVTAISRMLLDHGDEAVLCLNAVDRVLPGIGVECFFHQKRGLDPRWRPLLRHLAAAGLASTGRVEALLRWPAVVTPADVPWPERLVARSLTQPANVFGVIERRLSHVKVALDHEGRASAKAYFGSGHVWSRPIEPATRRPSPGPRPAASVDDAVDAGLAFLLRARNQGGWWRDFFDRGRPADVDRRVTGYASDEWVTGYIATMLAAVDREAAVDALALLLARQRDDDGWGYHALLPADADTTTWVLRLADAVGAPPHPRLVRGRAFVTSLVGPTGGIATYPREAAGQLEAFLQLPGPYDGWCAEHVCVTAAAAMLELGPTPLEFVARAQRDDGSWGGHWWDDDEYATLRAIESLGRDTVYEAAVRRGASWAAKRLQEELSPFARALGVAAACAGGEQDAVRQAVRALLSEQRTDGSWTPSARLRVPAPSAVDPLAEPATTLSYVDDDALFTTATVVAALARVAAP